MDSEDDVELTQQQQDDIEWGWLMYEKLRFWQYYIMPTGQLTAFFISDGCDEVQLPKEDCERFLVAIKRSGCEHEAIVADVLKKWPQEIVVHATFKDISVSDQPPCEH